MTDDSSISEQRTEQNGYKKQNKNEELVSFTFVFVRTWREKNKANPSLLVDKKKKQIRLRAKGKTKI